MAFARIPTGRYVSVSCMTSKWLIAGAEFLLSSFYLVLTLVEEQINSKPVAPGASISVNIPTRYRNRVAIIILCSKMEPIELRGNFVL